jgi:hypothetical protein
MEAAGEDGEGEPDAESEGNEAADNYAEEGRAEAIGPDKG